MAEADAARRKALVEVGDPAALAAILGGYTNAAEQCAGVPPGAGRDAANADDAAEGQDAGLTLEIARELVADLPRDSRDSRHRAPTR